MANSKVLIFNFQIGDEDGPYPMIYLLDANRWNDNRRLIVANIGEYMFDCYALGCEYIEDKYRWSGGRHGMGTYDRHSTWILQLFKDYNIVDIIEIHDWYDFLSDERIIELQRTLDRKYQVKRLSNNAKKDVHVIVIVPYNQEPAKYVIPVTATNAKYLIEQVYILEDDDIPYEQKQRIADQLRPYSIEATMYDIFTTYCISSIDLVKCDTVYLDNGSINDSVDIVF